MGTVIDALTVSLGLDASGFTAGQKETSASLKKIKDESSVVAKQMQADGKRAAEMFSAVKVEALGLIGVLLGGKGLETFAKDATNSMAALGRSAKNIGLAVPELAAFQNMIDRNGGSADAATASMQGYAAAVQRFREFGDASVFQFLTPIGAGIDDTPLQVYMKFMKFVEDHKGLKNGVQEIGIIGKGLGYDQGMIDAAVQIGSVSKAVDGMAESDSIGVRTQDMVDKMTALQKAWIGLGEAAKHDGEMMLSKMAPGLQAVADGIEKMIEKNPQALAGISAVAGYLTVIASLNFSDVMAFFARALPILSLVGLTGFAGGEDKEFSDAKNAEFLKKRDAAGGDPIVKWWEETMPEFMGGKPQPAKMDAAQQQRLAGIRDRLAGELGISKDAAAGIVSNLFAESGVHGINEQHPTVAGSRGGFGWGQWTGGRRVAYEKYSQDHMLDPKSDEANQGFLIQELRTKYPDILRQLQAGKITPKQAADAFFAYESGGSLGLEKNRAGHVVNAVQIAGFDPALNIGPRGGSSGAPVSNSTATTVGTVIINTQATDAHSIAGSLASELATQANRGAM